MVLWFCFYEGSGQKVRPSCSKDSEEEVVWRAFAIFILPGEMVLTELDKSLSLGENVAQINLRTKQKYEVLLLHLLESLEYNFLTHNNHR